MSTVWRPSRRSWFTAAIWLLLTAAGIAAMAGLHLVSAYVPTAAAAALASYHGGLALRGRTELTDGELRNRVWRTRVLPWNRVTSVFVEGAAFGEAVSIGGKALSFRLAAPRTGPIARDPRFEERLAELKSRVGEERWRRRRHPGWAFGCILVPLLALTAYLAIAVDEPWRADWWPGVHLASTAPDPCAVFDDATVRRAFGAEHDAGQPTDEYTGAACGWHRRSGRDFSLVLAYDVVDTGSLDARDLAVDAVQLFAGKDRRPVPGLGDEAYRMELGAKTTILVRTANVVTQVRFDGDPAVAIGLARTAVAALVID